MQFPESWLREFCNPPLSTQQLADLLTMSGMEVEETRPWRRRSAASWWPRSSSAEQHPQADRLRVCTVDAGRHSRRPLADRLRRAQCARGIRVPLAIVGRELPPGEDGKPFKIGVGKLRGVESRGMLCSARELKLATTTAACWNWPPTRRGRRHPRLAEARRHALHAQAHAQSGACLSVYGIAREVAALTGAPLKAPAIAAGGAVSHDQRCRWRCRRRPVRPLLGPHRARRRHPGQDAGLDGRPPGALRPAQRDGAGGHLQLRDVRVRPPVAHLRPRQDPRRLSVRWGRRARR
jgi:phenylalanyl-tRNA synthetase beta chain